jgi:hypothetical protein
VYDFRYHIASLVAVIVMLGVGMLLGSAIVDRGTLTQPLVLSLQKDFADLKKSNDQLKADLARDQQFAKAAADAMAAGKLTGRTVAIVVNEGRTDGLAAATSAILNAGGHVAVAHFSDKSLGLATDAALAGKVASSTDASTPPEQVALVVGRQLADEWSANGFGKGPITDQLVSAGKLRLSDSPTGTRIDALALMASWDGATDPALVELARQMQADGVVSMGAESRTRTAGVVDAAGAAGLSTVNDVDSASGGYSLVEVLAGIAKGRFGTGAGATQPFPPPQVGPTPAK